MLVDDVMTTITSHFVLKNNPLTCSCCLLPPSPLPRFFLSDFAVRWDPEWGRQSHKHMGTCSQQSISLSFSAISTHSTHSMQSWFQTVWHLTSLSLCNLCQYISPGITPSFCHIHNVFVWCSYTGCCPVQREVLLSCPEGSLSCS